MLNQNEIFLESQLQKMLNNHNNQSQPINETKPKTNPINNLHLKTANNPLSTNPPYPQDQQCQPYIEWLPSQNGFNITNISNFSQTVLPTYFKHQNYSSFVRQLNMYGFSKIRGKQGNHVYENRNFKRGSRSSLKKIQRKVTGETKKKEEDVVLFKPQILGKNKESQIQRIKERQIQLQQQCVSLLQKNKQLLQQNSQITKAIHQEQKKRQLLLSQIISIISKKQDEEVLALGSEVVVNPAIKQTLPGQPLANKSQKQTISAFGVGEQVGEQVGEVGGVGGVGEPGIGEKGEVEINLLDNREVFLNIEDFLNVDYDQFSDIFKL